MSKTPHCFKCNAEIYFDDEHIGKNGRKIPLDPETDAPHICQPTVAESERVEIERPKPVTVPHSVVARVEIMADARASLLQEHYNKFVEKIRGFGAKILGSTFQTDTYGFSIAVFYEIPANAVSEIEK